MEISTLRNTSAPSIVSNKYFQCHLPNGRDVHRYPSYLPYFEGSFNLESSIKLHCYIKRR